MTVSATKTTHVWLTPSSEMVRAEEARERVSSSPLATTPTQGAQLAPRTHANGTRAQESCAVCCQEGRHKMHHNLVEDTRAHITDAHRPTRTVIQQSHRRTVAQSYSRTVAQSHSRTVAHSHSRTVAQSHSRTATQSHSHTHTHTHLFRRGERQQEPWRLRRGPRSLLFLCSDQAP